MFGVNDETPMASRGRGRRGQGAQGDGQTSASSAKVAPGRASVFERLGTKQTSKAPVKAKAAAAQTEVKIGDAVEALFAANSRRWKPAVVTKVELPGQVMLRFDGYVDEAAVPLERVRKAVQAPEAKPIDTMDVEGAAAAAAAAAVTFLVASSRPSSAISSSSSSSTPHSSSR